MPRNLCLVTAYDGTDFHGWQRQPGLRTVQGELENALQHVVRHPVELAGSGRTDAGVHALGHVSNFMTECSLDPARLQAALTSRLPEDLAVLAVREVPLEFHATQSALSKLYRYRIHHSPIPPVARLLQRYMFHCWTPLDVEAMRDAAGHFVGEMDFSAMTPKAVVRESFVRRVLHCEVAREGEEIRIDVEGNGFLYHQVRTMAGTLVEVGRGRWRPEAVAEILASRDRNRGGPTMPAHGLCLHWVRYPPHLLPPQAFGPAPAGGDVADGDRSAGTSAGAQSILQ
ncbi:MAG: tRNA pseudouridine(38-40) synthase TruA [Planctomycetes bacterium]|nr:tRNA pseudouridine(38-40) synthase TruA [Planctomycetota bacterium]